MKSHECRACGGFIGPTHQYCDDCYDEIVHDRLAPENDPDLDEEDHQDDDQDDDLADQGWLENGVRHLEDNPDA